MHASCSRVQLRQRIEEVAQRRRHEAAAVERTMWRLHDGYRGPHGSSRWVNRTRLSCGMSIVQQVSEPTITACDVSLPYNHSGRALPNMMFVSCRSAPPAPPFGRDGEDDEDEEEDDDEFGGRDPFADEVAMRRAAAEHHAHGGRRYLVACMFWPCFKPAGSTEWPLGEQHGPCVTYVPAMRRGAMGEGWRGEHSLAQVMMGMFEAGGPVSASALRLMESGRHSHRAMDAMRQVRRVHHFELPSPSCSCRMLCLRIEPCRRFL